MDEDPRWPRASGWPAPDDGQGTSDLTVLGVPAHRTSISASGAHATPAAIREALARYSTYSWTHDVDVARLVAIDAGDVAEPDGVEGEQRVAARAAELVARTRLLVALGGDNSITYAVARGAWGDAIGRAGLITLDAHHDLRDGESNGSPVRRLVEAGLSGTRVVQIGIADFSNSREYAARARDLGVTVVTRDALRRQPMGDVLAEALYVAGAGGGRIHVDLDVDVCDRSVAPGCPAAAPGGLTADELRQVSFLCGRAPRVASLDITEIDATADAPDGRTVRLGALLLLEAACGLAIRPTHHT
jgi:formiminoglutamase